MSVINQMLQDLDARAGQPGAAPLPGDIRPVPPPARRAPWLRTALAGGALVAVAAAGVVGWRMMDAAPTPATAPVAPAVAASNPAPAVTLPGVVAAPGPSAVLVDMPAAAPVQVADVAPRTAAPPPAEAEPEPEPEPDPAPVKAGPRTQAAPVQAKPASAPRKPAAAAAATAPGGKVEPSPQRAENAYRQALVVLEDGRVTEAIATLQAGLKIDPRHEPSRQTLVGLLIEAKRPEDAMRQLQTALALDARQPAMAMLLARLQLEHGGPAVDTLTRTLPYAAGNGDYHAFLAGVLQREGRHREAAEHYRGALATAPQHGVWWMGMGISLQADKRDAEAAAAFGQAQASATLSADLQAFVERRLRQLGR